MKIIFLLLFPVTMLLGMQKNSQELALREVTEPIETKQTYKKAFFFDKQEQASLEYSIKSKNNIPASAEINSIMERSKYGGCWTDYTNLTALLLIRTILEINQTDDFRIEVRAFSHKAIDAILFRLGCHPYSFKGSSLDWGYLISNKKALEKLKKMQENIESHSNDSRFENRL